MPPVELFLSSSGVFRFEFGLETVRTVGTRHHVSSSSPPPTWGAGSDCLAMKAVQFPAWQRVVLHEDPFVHRK
jgi:hypothetical protein